MRHYAEFQLADSCHVKRAHESDALARRQGERAAVIARRALQAHFHGERNVAADCFIAYRDGGVRREIDVVQCPFETDASIGVAAAVVGIKKTDDATGQLLI